MRLSSFIKNSTREAAIVGVGNIKRHHLRFDKLIADRNPLITNGVKSVLKHSHASKPFRIDQTKINTFLAASSLSHLLDGWMYLSNAFDAVINGDESTAIHLAYYAELRSAMSILATEGVGVFSDKHLGAFASNTNAEYPTNYFKTPGGKYVVPKSPTHTFVWDAMDKWSNSTLKPNADILKIFKVNSRDFYDLTEHFHPATSGSTLMSVRTIKSWLKDWCFDIKSYKNDRKARNDASYRPQRIQHFDKNIDFQNIINDLNKYWSVISPSGSDKFSLLDRYLLRKLYSNLFIELGSPGNRKELIENAFNQIGVNGSTLFDFLNFEHPFTSDHLIFEQAAIKKTTPMSIIARATLLLRVSVGLVSQLYHEGGINKNNLEFVWNNYGIDCGFWNSGNIPADFNNLWANVQPLFDDLTNDINTPGNDLSIFSISQRKPEELYHFGQINRACLWGLDF